MSVTSSKKPGECPNCGYRILASRGIFGKQFKCPRCGVLIYVSAMYLRVLFLLSATIGLTLAALIVGVRNPVRVAVFGIPLGFVTLMLLVRTVPHVRLPVFLLRDPEELTSFTTLSQSNEKARTSSSSEESRSSQSERVQEH